MVVIRVLLAASMGLCVNATAIAQNDSGKVARIIVPYAPGGVSDVTNRIMASHLSKSLGHAVVVENRAGANANIGPAIAAEAAADGLTVLASSSYFTINPLVEKNLRWHPKQFIPVARFAISPNVIVVPAASPYGSLKDLLTAARAKPGMPIPGYGVGASQSIVTTNLQDAANVKFLTVPYKGGVTYVADLINGTLAMGVVPLNVGIGLIKGGQLRALAITGATRSALLPEVPTLIESGFPTANAETWLGYHVPRGTPTDVQQRLLKAVQGAAESQEVKSQFEKVGVVSAFLPSNEFEAFLQEDTARAGSFVRLVGG